MAQDTYYVGYIKGVGHIYQQTVIDTYSKIGFAKLYDRKNALVAADMLNDRVVPFFEQHDLKLMRMLTDRGTEYCGNRETHEYELYLAIEDIDHSKIKAKSPQTNGICERFNRTVQNEFYAIAFRKKIYTSIEQLQADLDTWMNSYNTQRTHSGKYCFGKTPMQTFLEGMEVARRYQLQDAGKIQPDEQVIGSPGCESENSCVSSQMASDSFLSDSIENVRTSLDYYNPLLTVHIHNLVRGQFPDVCEAECGEAGKDKQVSGESKRGIGKLMLDKLPDFPLRKILPFLHVGRDAELRKRVSRYQTVVMRP